MTQERAVEILKEYLSDSQRLDGYYPHLYLDRIQEYEFCWLIPHTSKEYFETQDLRKMPVGAGPYLIDKESEKLYITGSAPVDWVKDFELMREGKESEWPWNELRNEFLEVKFEFLSERKIFIQQKTVNNEQINVFLEEVLKPSIGKEFSPIIKRLKYNEFQTTFLIGNQKEQQMGLTNNLEELTLNEIPTISLKYNMKSHHSFAGPINEIKDWLRINQAYKATDNFWIEVCETDLNKPFNKWDLKMSLEICKKAYNNT